MAVRIKVIRKKDEPIERLIKRWKKKFEEAEIKEELAARKEYIKPSRQKYIQRQQAIRQNKQEVELKKIEDGLGR